MEDGLCSVRGRGYLKRRRTSSGSYRPIEVATAIFMEPPKLLPATFRFLCNVA